ncbi:hypothetical protein J5N97_003625 [Dioscorea zingiberensis]|uniref:Transcription factor GAMYB n=1 Tax=Dioscorea zingiberensis TaxID=325984 RepID=A0A9D5D665_9LILI|nr:hypothetical protein J5N97_003625 [Dioscorea zingiberensis]
MASFPFKNGKYTTDERDNRMGTKDKDKISSPLLDDCVTGGSVGGGTALKKGPWTSAEDALLVEYVNKHGEGNWNAVQKYSGLSRCGKSCRLRWANHLRPNLKKGAFSREEEEKIIELHSQMGNKWARMAAHLPGRTDNEIKNYWNTRAKRCIRHGLPVYPHNMIFNENKPRVNVGEFRNDDNHPNELLHGNSLDFSVSMFDNIKPSPGVLPYVSSLVDFSPSNMSGGQGFGSQNYGFMNPTMNCAKQLQESETLFPHVQGSIASRILQFDPISDQLPVKIHQPFEFLSDPDPVNKDPTPYGGVVNGSHAHTLINGNFSANSSASRTLPGSLKLELPSLQYPETNLGSWPVCSTPEPVDAYVQSPPATMSMHSDIESPRKCGLLEALIYEAQTLRNDKNYQSEKSTSSSVLTRSEVVESSRVNICETDCEVFNDPISQHSPPVSENPLEEFPVAKATFRSDAEMITAEHFSEPKTGDKCVSSQPVSPQSYFRPDVLLGSSWVVGSGNDHYIFDDPIETLLNGELSAEHKQSLVGTSSKFPQDCLAIG